MTVFNVFCTFTGPLMTILSSSNSELVYVCLCHIDVLLSKVPKLFEQEYRSFFSRYRGGSGNQRLGWVIYTVPNIVTSFIVFHLILCFFALYTVFFCSFFFRHADPQYIKTKKLDILTTIASVSNVEEVVTELR